MVAVRGTYQNGHVTLAEEVTFDDPVDVIVTFLEEEKKELGKRLTLEDFSFAEARKIMEKYNISLSDAVIEERRSSL